MIPYYNGLAIHRNQENLMPESEAIRETKARITQLEKQLADLEERLPAHSIPPNLIAEMDNLDEQIQDLKQKLQILEEQGDTHRKR
jgi:polyhydroxyalkanoate synthesis regulator phasin